MKLRTLNKTKFENIKINEVFASKDDDLWNIYLKISDKKVFYVANDSDDIKYFSIGEKFYRGWDGDKFAVVSEIYKLPKYVQRLFKEE